jgi:hypothetical protein
MDVADKMFFSLFAIKFAVTLLAYPEYYLSIYAIISS